MISRALRFFKDWRPKTDDSIVQMMVKFAQEEIARRPEPPRREAEEECRARIPGRPCVYVCQHCHEVAPDTAALTPAKGKE
jgi:hypothetical protein